MADIDKQTGKPFKAVAPIVPTPKPPTSAAAQAWSRFCDELKTAGHLLLSQPGTEDAVMEAETLRFLIRELRSGIEWETECASSDFPRFFRNDDSGSGPPGPNIDNSYYKAYIRPGTSYRVTIDTRTISDIILCVFNHEYRTYGDHSLRDFKVGPDGLLEIWLSEQPQLTNWVQLPNDAYRLAIRVYYVDWERHSPPALTIERLGSESEAEPLPTVQCLDEALQSTIQYLQSWPFKYPIFQTLYADQIEPNVMRSPLGIPGGAQEVQYGVSRYRLADDEALLVESEVPDAAYWGFHLYTMPWFSQIAVGTRITALNHLQSFVHADGKVRYVVSKSDPGIQNWLDTGGFPTGSIFYRWIWSRNSPTPVSRVVKLTELRAALPSDTPTLGAADRPAQIAARRRHLQRRFRA